jgi:chemotaxis protein MotB
MIRRKPIDDDDENPDRWLVSYADFITLLFAFFVVMYAISSVNQGKYTTLTTSMGTAFIGAKSGSAESNQTRIGTQSKQTSLIKPLPLSHLQQEKVRRERENMTRMGIDIANKLDQLTAEGKVNVLQNNRGIRIDINESLLFSSGSATLGKDSTEIIKEIANEINSSEHYIQVEGHTDMTPINTPEFFSNWELSAMRATAILHVLNETGIDEKKLSAVAYGAGQPISDNETIEGRAKNRRVSIMVLYESQNPDVSAATIVPQTKVPQTNVSQTKKMPE